jgi:hypothetical protein
MDRSRRGDKGGALGPSELHRLISPESRQAPFLNTGLQLDVGRPGQEKYREQVTIELVARSLALHAAGRTPTQADEQAASEYNETRPPQYRNQGLAQTIAVYRKKLRDDPRR